ncbi:MAG: hypothetical protein GX098_01565 [Bacteroidales bacterium]|nr:hypothetical protein [Bacteroidales bacterium]
MSEQIAHEVKHTFAGMLRQGVAPAGYKGGRGLSVPTEGAAPLSKPPMTCGRPGTYEIRMKRLSHKTEEWIRRDLNPRPLCPNRRGEAPFETPGDLRSPRNI